MREPIRYLSLFSGMEAAHLAWAPLGWECVAVAEIEPAACALLAHRLPHVPNLGSVTDITAEKIAALGHIDVVIGGSPCQDLSVAGKRAGLAGARSGLFHEQLRIFNAARTLCGARWLVWENVPGAFSINQGRDFAVVVGALAGCELNVPPDGWGSEGVALGDNGLVEWSVLDAQWFGVAQRRRRVFAVLDTGDWAGRPPVLLEPDSLRGDSAPRREAGEGITGTLSARTSGGGGLGTDFDIQGGLVPDVAPTLLAQGNRTGGDRPPGTSVDTCESLIPEVAHTLRVDGFDASEDGTGRGTPLVPVLPFDTTQITSATNGSSPKLGDPCHPLCAGAHAPAIAFDCKASGQAGFGVGDIASTMRSMDHADSHQNGGGHLAVQQGMQVRRLTPRECERLQGAPDDWTLVPNVKGKPMADGPRYRMLGNSFAVPVIRWIGQRIQIAHTWLLRAAA
ncbi:DNA cytosine methyltransferase [Stenotrophomonas acidaminiphila]|uniref:DNA cytosine methyltransferase n=1 Tax=Stenotrophomonas acidaminiphila TaxID=128780 RepID=UPI0028B19A58|nr:DNA cytosine methyltransferase [Stenotrophomonas acidaminiphila]